MKRKNILAIGLMLSLMLASLVLVTSEEVSAANTIHVDSSGGRQYTTISEAITNAIDDDIIKVHVGVGYDESFTVDKKLTIEGVLSGSTRPTICSTQYGDTITITSDTVTIKDLIITRPSSGYPGNGIVSSVTAGEHTSVDLINLKVELHYIGILCGTPDIGPYASHHNIQNCEVPYNAYNGIQINSNPNPEHPMFYANNLISESTISYNGQSGIWIRGDWNYIRNTVVVGNGGDGIWVIGDYNEIYYNSAYPGECRISGNSLMGINLWGISNNNQVKNGVEINNNGAEWYLQMPGDHGGIFMYGDDNEIIDCSIHENANYGIWSYYGLRNKIEDCQVYSNGDLVSGMGIWIDTDSSSTSIIDCNVYSNTNNLHIGSSTNSILGCTMSNGHSMIYSGSGTIVTNCDFSNSDDWLLSIFDSDNNDIIDCNFDNADIAINIDEGLNIDIFGENNSGDYSDITNCNTALYASYLDDGDPGTSTGRIKNYDIDTGSDITLIGSSPTNKVVFKWNTIPNESNLDVSKTNADWLLDNSF